MPWGIELSKSLTEAVRKYYEEKERERFENSEDGKRVWGRFEQTKLGRALAEDGGNGDANIFARYLNTTHIGRDLLKWYGNEGEAAILRAARDSERRLRKEKRRRKIRAFFGLSDDE